MGDLYRYIFVSAFTCSDIFTLFTRFLWTMVPIIMYLWTNSKPVYFIDNIWCV